MNAVADGCVFVRRKVVVEVEEVVGRVGLAGCEAPQTDTFSFPCWNFAFCSNLERR